MPSVEPDDFNMALEADFAGFLFVAKSLDSGCTLLLLGA